METNYAKSMYKLMEQIEIDPVEPKTKRGGLLSSSRNSVNKDMNQELINQPAYRVAKYVNTIRNKRLGFKNNGRETT